MPHRILVVEGHTDTAHMLQRQFAEAGYRVTVAHDGPSALTAFEECEFDLVILEVVLPHMDGLEVCRRMRTGSTYVPILMLTSKATELDRVLGLELGADDYGFAM